MAEPVNTPMPPGTPIPGTPRSTSPAPPVPSTSPPTAASSLAHARKPIVLHLGDPVRYNPDTYAQFAALFDVVRPSAAERTRPAFQQALRERRWGDFAAVFRPSRDSGGEMGRWDAALVALLPPACRVVASAGAGSDPDWEWADAAAAAALGARGVVCCDGGLAAAEAVADFAVALVVGVFRALPYCAGAAAARDPARFAEARRRSAARARNLRARALGVVGLGSVGQQVAARCRLGFGMDVLYHDVAREAAGIEERLGARFCASLEALCRASDCVVLCAPPAGGGARPLISAESLSWFRPGARLVNVACGSLVDEDALADALADGRLAAAALDVHADEPRVHPRLAAMADDNVLLTCHNAGGTVETHIGFEELAMRNIIAVLGGKPPITPVNLQWLRRA